MNENTTTMTFNENPATEENGVIYYTYLFNYFGGETHNGKPVSGASVDVLLKCYNKNGEIISFERDREVRCDNYSLCDAFIVSVDKETVVKIEPNKEVYDRFIAAYDLEKIEAEQIAFYLDYIEAMPKELQEQLDRIASLSGNVKSAPYSVPNKVTEEEFKGFITEHFDDFNISDNEKAQVPCFGFVS